MKNLIEELNSDNKALCRRLLKKIK